MIKKISIFDLDDTLTVTLTFANFINAKSGDFIDINEIHSSYFKSIKSLFFNKLSKEVFFKRMGDYIVVINKQNDETFDGSYLDNFDKDKKTSRYFEVKNNILVVKSFPGFHSDPNTIGKEINTPVFEEYKKIENRMILTGRDEKLRPLVEENLKKIGIDFPKFGLKMYSGSSGIKNWKANVILKSIEENNWEEIHYFEDRQDWLHFAESQVNEKYPAVKFITHLISNVQDQHKFN